MARTSPSPDYRSDKMESLEGKAIARGRFLVFWDAIDPDVLAEASDAPLGPATRGCPMRSVAMSLVRRWSSPSSSGSGWPGTEAVDSESSSTPGGRKIRRFRSAYGVHPDEWQPDWIKLDTAKVWRSQLEEDLALARGFDPSSD